MLERGGGRDREKMSFKGPLRAESKLSLLNVFFKGGTFGILLEAPCHRG